MIHLKGARGLILALLALLLIPAAAPSLAWGQPKFPPLTGRVVDNANLLSPQVEQRLDQELAGLEQSTGRQLVVATLPDLQGYEIEEYGYQLGRAWGIGSKERNDGVLLLVAPNERKVRIEVGYGLEGVLTDALSSVIINTAIVPQFKQGNFEQGIVAGTDELVKQLSLPDEEARANVAKAAERREAKSGGGGGVTAFIVILVIFWVLAGMLRGLGGRRRGGSGLWWLLPIILSSGGGRHRGGGWGGGGGFGGGFGGGSFGGGGSSGSW